MSARLNVNQGTVRPDIVMDKYDVADLRIARYLAEGSNGKFCHVIVKNKAVNVDDGDEVQLPCGQRTSLILCKSHQCSVINDLSKR